MHGRIDCRYRSRSEAGGKRLEKKKSVGFSVDEQKENRVGRLARRSD
jgi:hypothetical protein